MWCRCYSCAAQGFWRCLPGVQAGKLTEAARALYARLPTDSELNGTGLSVEDYITEIDVWPENWPAIQLFRQMATQWRIGMNGPTGLDYQTLFLLIDRQELSKEDAAQMFDDMRVCEAAALEAMFENAR